MANKVYVKYANLTIPVATENMELVSEVVMFVQTKFPTDLGRINLNEIRLLAGNQTIPYNQKIDSLPTTSSTTPLLVVTTAPISAVPGSVLFSPLSTTNPWTTFIPDLQGILFSLGLPVPEPIGEPHLQATARKYVHQFLQTLDQGEKSVYVFDEVQIKLRLFIELIKEKKAAHYKSSLLVTGTPPVGRSSPDYDSAVRRATNLSLTPLSVRGLMAIFEAKYGRFFETASDTKLFLDLYTCFSTDIALWYNYLPTFFGPDHAKGKKLSVPELEKILTMVHDRIRSSEGDSYVREVIEEKTRGLSLTTVFDLGGIIQHETRQGIATRIRGVDDFLKSLTKRKYVKMNNYHLNYAAMLEKASTDSAPFHKLRGFGLEDICTRVINERLSLRPQNFMAEFFGVESNARWFLEFLDYGNNTDADFLIVEGTKSSESLLEQQCPRQVIIGNIKNNPYHLMEEASVKKFTCLMDSFRAGGFKPTVALFAGENISTEDESRILICWANVDILPNVLTLPNLLKYLVEKPNLEPYNEATCHWDRIPEKERITASIPEGGTLIVTGPWQTGKTTLLSELAKEKNWPYYSY